MLKFRAFSAVFILFLACEAEYYDEMIEAPNVQCLDGQTRDLEYSNEYISLKCINCCISDAPVLQESFDLQTEAYLCIADYLNYFPGISQSKRNSKIKYIFTYNDDVTEVGLNMGYEQDAKVFAPGFIGMVRNSRRVNDVRDVRMDVHETTHAFTNEAMSDCASQTMPAWLHEAFSINSETRLHCSPRQAESFRFEMGQVDWNRLRVGLAPLYNSLEDPHTKGRIFIAALNDDYSCKMHCLAKIWNALRQEFMRGQAISNEKIKEVAEKVTGKDLSYLFQMLNLF